MKVPKSSNGLYQLDFTVTGKRKSKVLKGIIDTGSTHCACTFKVITTLQIRPIEWGKISSVHKTERVLIYSAIVGFDGKKMTVPFARVPQILPESTTPNDIHIIIGLDVLSECVLNFESDCLDIKWK